MALFDRFKKKEEPTIKWEELELLPNMNVGNYVKRILMDYPRTSGVIFLNDIKVPFSYGNLQEIVNPSLYPNIVKKVEIFEDKNNMKMYFRLTF